MGVPKFFRYISERYPCLSELVKEYQIPEFDNLYLDMNGIIHMCSHPDDNNPHFRITEERIFKDIFHYIEVLFRMIRPQKLFFMAIDGVAPRAKMNQQRGRRFRSAKDAVKQEQEAKKKGEQLPTEERFDSNCITPGTVFMARLHDQLKYFVSEKISNDPLWSKCKIILSGHETPGEGEHKIMDYIRYMRAQPGYDPNTRHCLYGLDADLIMLGLCTHEPHFSLLREEVKFGKKNNSKRSSVPEEITFFLLHLSLMREYLELEFAPLKNKLQGFQYDFEKIIDDWVLMGFLVGNDFIPHLPNLHITNGALPILYKAYMDILPTLDGYINESGTLNLVRFEKFLHKLGELDVEYFEEVKDDLMYLESKRGKNALDVDNAYLDLYEEISGNETKKILSQFSEDMTLYDNTSDESDEDDAFTSFKKDYYKRKLEYENVTPEVMRDQAEGYVRAIQWNLNYYYNGVCSWSWYYPHHYAPYISDIKDFTNFKIDFDLGKPFKPYEQLLAVLPSASKSLLPLPYQDLMTNENSPIKKYYPEDFQTDLNGKRQEWEAVVLLPFLDENQLLDAMAPCNEKLTPEEVERNSHGPMLVYQYTPDDLGQYPAPAYFPVITHNHAKCHAVYCEEIAVPKEKLVKGAYPGVKMDVYYPGFPTFKHLNYMGELEKAKIKVFEQPSRNESMIITLLPDDKNENYSGNEIPTQLVDKCVYVNWPHLVEAKIVGISNEHQKYICLKPEDYVTETRTAKSSLPSFEAEYSGIVERYKTRMGIEVGDVKLLVHVKIMTGRKYMFSPSGRLTLEKQFADLTCVFPIQTVVMDVKAYDEHNSVFQDVFDVFPEGSICYTLTNPYYGSQGKILNSTETIKNGRLKLLVSYIEEPDFSSIKDLENIINQRYKTLTNSASQVGMSNFLFSRITGSIFLTARDGDGGLKNVSAGLDLKFNKRNKETPGYTRKLQNTWYYTDKAVELVREFSEKFPEIFTYLKSDDNRNYDEIAIEQIFGDNWEIRMKELNAWLRSIPTNSIERKTCGGMGVDTEIIAEIERIVDSTKDKLAAKRVTMQIKPSFLFKPELQSRTCPADPKMQVKLFDRIVNVRQGYSVPVGLKGTIVSINEVANGTDQDTMYDVLFDEEFKDGMALNCSPGRGYRLPKPAFINISHGKRLLEEKTGRPAELIAKAEAQKFHPSLPANSTLRNQFIPMQVQRQLSQNASQSEASSKNEPELLSNNWRDEILAKDKAETQLPAAFNVTPNKDEKRDNTQWLSGNKFPHPSIQQQYERTQKLYQQQYLAQQQRMASIQQQQQQQYNRGPPPTMILKNNQPPPSGNYQQRVPPNVNQSRVPQQRIPPVFQQTQYKTPVAVQPQQFVNSKYYQVPPAVPIGNQQSSAFAQFSSDRNQKMLNKPVSAKPKPQHVPTDMIDFMPFKREEPSRPREHVDTDFLKKILSIGDTKKVESSPGGVKQTVTVQNKPKRVANSANNGAAQQKINNDPPEKDEPQASVSFEIFAKAAKAPATVRLMTYYQSNGMGLPRYQYFTNKNSTHAQITLPTGRVLTGKPAEDKNTASENVASDALDLLIQKKIEVNQEKSEDLPVPPTSWVEPQKENITPKQENKSKTDSVPLNNSMVPLQALRRQVSKNRAVSEGKEQKIESAKLSVDDPLRNVTDDQKIVTEINKKPIEEKKSGPIESAEEITQKKKKKIRIAANFQALKK